MSGDKEIDWDYWIALPSVKLWEAIALSLDIDPAGMERRDEGLHGGLLLPSNAFPSASIKKEYSKRLRLLASALPVSTEPNPINPSFHNVPLGDVVTRLATHDRKPIAAGMLAGAAIKEAITLLLAELKEPITSGWLGEQADQDGDRSGLVANVDEKQLLALVRDTEPGWSTLGDSPDWKNKLRAALAQRIENRVRAIEERRESSAKADSDRLAEKLKAGRYTIAEAADMAGEDKKQLLKSLKCAAESGALPVYRSWSKQRWVANEKPSWFLEAYWDDLNAWLAANEKRIEFRFKEPVRAATTPTPIPPLPPKPSLQWVSFALAEGEKLRASNPKWKKEKLAQKLSEILDCNGVRGRGGKRLSAETIRRHALRQMQ